MFPDADKVVIDRKENRHAAFARHSPLRRFQPRAHGNAVAIEEWLSGFRISAGSGR